MQGFDKISKMWWARCKRTKALSACTFRSLLRWDFRNFNTFFASQVVSGQLEHWRLGNHSRVQLTNRQPHLEMRGPVRHICSSQPMLQLLDASLFLLRNLVTSSSRADCPFCQAVRTTLMFGCAKWARDMIGWQCLVAVLAFLVWKHLFVFGFYVY